MRVHISGTTRQAARVQSRPSKFVLPRFLTAVFFTGFCCMLTGCSLFVMGSRVLFGDPTMTSAFAKTTQVNLVKDKKRVLVICSTPEAVKAEHGSLNFDLLEGVTRRFKRAKIRLVDPNEVATWMDDNGGGGGEPEELAENFDTDYIIHIDLEKFTYHEENSPGLMRGRVSGTVYAYAVEERDGIKHVTEAFASDFRSVYPEHNPISADQMSAKVFRQKFLDRLCTEIGNLFSNYRVSDTIF